MSGVLSTAAYVRSADLSTATYVRRAECYIICQECWVLQHVLGVVSTAAYARSAEYCSIYSIRSVEYSIFGGVSNLPYIRSAEYCSICQECIVLQHLLAGSSSTALDRRMSTAAYVRSVEYCSLCQECWIGWVDIALFLEFHEKSWVCGFSRYNMGNYQIFFILVQKPVRGTPLTL